jgi:hypothetical protein
MRESATISNPERFIPSGEPRGIVRSTWIREAKEVIPPGEPEPPRRLRSIAPTNKLISKNKSAQPDASSWAL